MSHGVGKAKLAAMVAGAAVVGAGLGLLYSPQTGEETRRQVRDYAKHYAKRTRVEAANLGRSMKSGMDRAIEYGKSALPRREKASTRIAA